MALAALWHLWRGEVARIATVTTPSSTSRQWRTWRAWPTSTDPDPRQEAERGNTYLFQADRTIYRDVAGAHARGIADS